jgi:hypothetical protein
MSDDRSPTVQLAETRNMAALLAERPDTVSQALARMLESQVPGLEREAANEPPPPNPAVPSLIELMHPGAVPRFSVDPQVFAGRLQQSADQMWEGPTE